MMKSARGSRGQRYDPTHLGQETRLEKIMNVLEKEINIAGVLQTVLVICLQEIWGSSVDGLAGFFERMDFDFYPAMYNDPTSAFHMGVAMAVPKGIGAEITAREPIPGKNNIIQRAFIIPLGITVINFHMPGDARFGENARRYADNILGDIGDKTTLIWAGDFNLTPGDDGFQKILSGHDLADAASGLDETTASLTRDVVFRGCLDHILYGAGVRLVHAYVPGKKELRLIPDAEHGSDHVPVVADFEVLSRQEAVMALYQSKQRSEQYLEQRRRQIRSSDLTLFKLLAREKKRIRIHDALKPLERLHREQHYMRDIRRSHKDMLRRQIDDILRPYYSSVEKREKKRDEILATIPQRGFITREEIVERARKQQR